MIKTRTIYLSILAVVFLILLAILLYYALKTGIFADSPHGQEINRQDRIWDLDGNNFNEKVSLVKYNDNSKADFVLNVVDKNNKNHSITLDGFESETSFCRNNEKIQIGQKTFICISGYVGAHSQNIQLISFEDGKLTAATFVDNDSSQNRVSSDAPNFGFINSGEKTGIYIDNRNYDKDPTLDIIRSYYYFKEDAFVFDHSEEINYSNESAQKGTIS